MTNYTSTLKQAAKTPLTERCNHRQTNHQQGKMKGWLHGRKLYTSIWLIWCRKIFDAVVFCCTLLTINLLRHFYFLTVYFVNKASNVFIGRDTLLALLTTGGRSTPSSGIREKRNDQMACVRGMAGSTGDKRPRTEWPGTAVHGLWLHFSNIESSIIKTGAIMMTLGTSPTDHYGLMIFSLKFNRLPTDESMRLNPSLRCQHRQHLTSLRTFHWSTI